jgi:dihydroxyacetone kinase-like predicted kinase
VIGLVDDQLAAAGDDEADVARKTLAKAEAGDAELVTIFTGEGVSEADADQMVVTVRDMNPDAEVELHAGGQPHYRFIIAVE